jgi:hypothetical protein
VGAPRLTSQATATTIAVIVRAMKYWSHFGNTRRSTRLRGMERSTFLHFYPVL